MNMHPNAEQRLVEACKAEYPVILEKIKSTAIGKMLVNASSLIPMAEHYTELSVAGLPHGRNNYECNFCGQDKNGGAFPKIRGGVPVVVCPDCVREHGSDDTFSNYPKWNN